MKRQKKKYSKPRRPHDKMRMKEETELLEKYGLKNKKEIWKAEAAIARIRNLAKKLIVKSEEEKKAYVLKLNKKGFKVEKIADVLALEKEDWMKRRLQTIVFKKELSNTPKQARQFIVHKHVSIGNQIVNIPSYQVTIEEEPHIKLNVVLKNKEKNSQIDIIKEEILEDKENERRII